MNEYVVIYERAEDGGRGAYLPDLPGVIALGASRDEVAQGIHEAVDAYAEEIATSGPAPTRPGRGHRHDSRRLTRGFGLGREHSALAGRCLSGRCSGPPTCNP